MSSLSIWTIYDHPLDWPDFYVAREWTISTRDDNGPEPTDNVMLARNLDELRKVLAQRGLTLMPAEEHDDRAIVESWL